MAEPPTPDRRTLPPVCTDMAAMGEARAMRTLSARRGSDSTIGSCEIAELQSPTSPRAELQTPEFEGFTFEAADADNEAANFRWTSQADSEPASPKDRHNPQTAAMIQRRLLAVGDVADRELIGIRRRQLSPINVCGREVWGDRPKYHPAALSSHRDPLRVAEAVTRRKCHGLKTPLRSFGRSRSTHTDSPSRFRGRPKTREQPHQQEASSPSPLLGERVDTEAFLIDSHQLSVDPGSDPTASSVSSLGSLATRIPALRRHHGEELPSVQAVSPVAEGQCISTAKSAMVNSLLGQESAVQAAISDPLTLMLMYRRMLFQETNNGLMGGTPFICQARTAAGAATMDSSCFSRQVGPRKGASRGALVPLMSRS